VQWKNLHSATDVIKSGSVPELSTLVFLKSCLFSSRHSRSVFLSCRYYVTQAFSHGNYVLEFSLTSSSICLNFLLDYSMWVHFHCSQPEVYVSMSFTSARLRCCKTFLVEAHSLVHCTLCTSCFHKQIPFFLWLYSPCGPWSLFQFPNLYMPVTAAEWSWLAWMPGSQFRILLEAWMFM
jgi:hypothetical protein